MRWRRRGNMDESGEGSRPAPPRRGAEQQRGVGGIGAAALLPTGSAQIQRPIPEYSCITLPMDHGRAATPPGAPEAAAGGAEGRLRQRPSVRECTNRGQAGANKPWAQTCAEQRGWMETSGMWNATGVEQQQQQQQQHVGSLLAWCTDSPCSPEQRKEGGSVRVGCQRLVSSVGRCTAAGSRRDET